MIEPDTALHRGNEAAHRVVKSLQKLRRSYGSGAADPGAVAFACGYRTVSPEELELEGVLAEYERIVAKSDAV